MEIKRITYKKENRKYIEYCRTEADTNNKEDLEKVKDIYKDLSNNLINRLDNANWIKSVRNINNYDGTRTIAFYYDNGYSDKFIVSAHY